ncbi:hypothetical protein [Polyangium fumosum]|uniref:Uncharacterized protein n=1 Tax=Polyangium fumosum TaxID=889272 RepID=A0A4U1J575_9BACT|nr:hypothetical protein [Polyangium fumosum]TKD02407.1 hypothetical protein E8A74_28335 [Polyangium fumosum]
MRDKSVRPRKTSIRKDVMAVATRRRTRDVRTKEDEVPSELPTELALGSDGLIYVNAEGIDPARYAGRKMFTGFAMTPSEAERAVEEIHRLAFNVTVSAQAGSARSKKKKRG